MTPRATLDRWQAALGLLGSQRLRQSPPLALPTSAPRTALSAAAPLAKLRALGSEASPPRANDPPARRSGPVGPLAPLPEAPTRAAPASLQSLPAALRTSATPLTHHPAPATPSGPTSHSPSAETPPNARTLTAPCTQGAAWRDNRAASTRPPMPIHPPLGASSRTPQGASLPPLPLAPPRRHRAPPDAPTDALRSLQARSGIPSPSPDGPDDPKTPGFRPPDINQGRPSGTSVPQARGYADPPRIAPTSAQDDSGIHALLQLRRREARPPYPTVPAHRHHPARRCEHSRSDGQSGSPLRQSSTGQLQVVASIATSVGP